MRLLIIRHGDPDYSIDSLTEVGKIEAELLADRLCDMDISEFYVSPLGRARRTAEPTLKRTGRDGVTLDWLREFPPRVKRPDKDEASVAWDWLPADWTAEPRFYGRDGWWEPEAFKNAEVKAAYDYVTKSLDELLASHGYKREGNIYRATHPNTDTVALVCHFGLECVLLSHLLGISPMPLWHGTCAAPTSVTTLYTEERREGVASFRMAAFGDISHLYKAGREPSFAARFCETFSNENERHD